jgi:hypothetical protein
MRQQGQMFVPKTNASSPLVAEARPIRDSRFGRRVEMFRLPLALLLLLSCVGGHAERYPFLMRENAAKLAVMIARRDTCPMSEEQVRGTVAAAVKRSGIEPLMSEHTSNILVLRVGIGCLPRGGATLSVKFLDEAKGTMISYSTERVDATLPADLLDAVRAATEAAMVDYIESNAELYRR